MERTLTCMIVDDEEHAITQLTRSIEQIGYLRLLYSVTNPIEALEILNKQQVDIVFLDVEMPYINGIEFAKIATGKTHIILCTAHMQYAVEGFEVNVLDYLLKPVTYIRLLKAVEKVVAKVNIGQKLHADKNDCFFIKADVKHRYVQINFSDIEYIERTENYSCIYISGEKKYTLYSLTKMMDYLPSEKFIRVHASFIVPLRNISYVDANSLALKKPAITIPVSSKYKHELLAMIKAI